MNRTFEYPRSGCRALGLPGLIACLLLVGCGPRNFLNENDKLRRENLELRDQAAASQKQVQGLEAALAAERGTARAAAATQPLPAGVYAPHTASIAIGKYSGGADTNSDGTDDTLRIYLETYDAKSRFTPTVGRVRITVAAVPAGKPAVTVANATIEPDRFDQLYRSGMAGTHYTLQVPLTQPVPAEVSSLAVTVELTDLLTGQSFTAQGNLRYTARSK